MKQPDKPERKERKRRIKKQNARKKSSLEARTLRIVTPAERAEFERQMRGFHMFVEGLMLIAGVDLDELIRKYEDPFPSEIDVDGKGEGKP